MLGVASAMMLLCAVPALADDGPSGIAFFHNGSTMSVSTGPQDALAIAYAKPRKGLSARSGDLLFEGQLVEGTWADGALEGQAFTFKRGCKPAPYEVTGRIADEGPQWVITLSGAAPVRKGCKVVGYSAEGANARLTIESGVDD
jgi:hypothetical protein